MKNLDVILIDSNILKNRPDRHTWTKGDMIF